MPSAFILAVDQGTTNTKALLVDRQGDVVFRTARAVALLQPRHGWVEQDPVEIWRSVREAIGDCMNHAREAGSAIAGIAISNQRETALAWRAHTAGEDLPPAGMPVANAISWQCRRSSAICDKLAGYAERIRETTGLPLDPLLTGSKWAWLLENHTQAAALAQQGQLRLGTMDTWLIANLTGGRVHATDHTNASRTALLNLETLEWDQAMLELFGVPLATLPEIVPSSGIAGMCTAIPELAAVPIVAAIGDSHAALVGHGRYTPGTVKATYGTGSSLMTLTAGLAEPAASLARAVAWSTRDGAQFALEGNIAMTGAAMQWVGEFLGLPNPAADAAALAETVSDAAGVVFVPAMVGLGAPHWDKEARGTIANLERSHKVAHLARAALDAIAFQIADVFFAMETAAKIALPVLLCDGGASRNDTLMQMQADLLLRPVHRASDEELSALGAAWLGGLALGWWASFDELTEMRGEAKVFLPKISGVERDRLLGSWEIAVRRTRFQGELGG